MTLYIWMIVLVEVEIISNIYIQHRIYIYKQKLKNSSRRQDFIDIVKI